MSSFGGDSVLAQRLRRDLAAQIETEVQLLVSRPTKIRAGRIQGLQTALNLIDNPPDKEQEKRVG